MHEFPSIHCYDQCWLCRRYVDRSHERPLINHIIMSSWNISWHLQLKHTRCPWTPFLAQQRNAFWKVWKGFINTRIENVTTGKYGHENNFIYNKVFFFICPFDSINKFVLHWVKSTWYSVIEELRMTDSRIFFQILPRFLAEFFIQENLKTCSWRLRQPGCLLDSLADQQIPDYGRAWLSPVSHTGLGRFGQIFLKIFLYFIPWMRVERF